MISKGWIFVVFCFAASVKCLQADSAACIVAKEEYGGLRMLFKAFDNLTATFTQIAQQNFSDDAKAQQAVNSLCRHLNSSAQAVEKVITQCGSIAEGCQNLGPYPFTADVYRAAAKFCENVRIEEYIEHIRTLAPCGVALQSHRQLHPRTESEQKEKRRVYWLADDDAQAAAENSTASCRLTCGRRCACRQVQNKLLSAMTEPRAHIREVCGQKEHELFMELLNRAMNALNCSEFGDYVREWGWLKINYRANQSTPAPH